MALATLTVGLATCLFFCLSGGYSLQTDAAVTLYMPNVLNIELKTTASFNITWQPVEGTMLLSQTVDGSSVQLLSIRELEYTLYGSWARRKTSVAVATDNVTTTATVTMETVLVEDEGDFVVAITNESRNVVLRKDPLWVRTYAKPLDITLSIDGTNFTEGANAIINCTGNVGRPLGKLRLSQSASFSPDEFVFYDFVNESTVGHSSLPDGTYRVSHVFNVTLNHNNNKHYFRCDVISSVPRYTETYSNTVQIFVNVSGLQMTITPSTVTLNSPAQQGLTMICGLESLEKNENVKQFNVMSITRNSSRPGDPQLIAVVTDYNSSALPEGSDMGTPLHSGILKAKAGTTAQNEARLELKWEMSQVKCDFAGDYTCEVKWLEQDTYESKTWSKTATLAMKTTPEKPQIRLMRNGIPVTPQPINQNIATQYNEGDVLDLECTSNIGSSNDKTIKWQRTRRSGTNLDDLMVANDGTPTTITDELKNCTHHQTSMFKINVTADKFQTGKNIMLFLCEIDEGTFPSQPLQSQKIYIQMRSSGSGGKADQSVASAGGGPNAGAIAGGVIGGLVLIVLVVLLVYFLWYRKRSTGETCSTNVAAILGGVIGGLVLIVAVVVLVCLFWFRSNGGSSYRTKEENGPDNPNMVPETTPTPYSTTDYAIPHKERKAYQNEALDEPHEDRSRRRNDHRDRRRDDRDNRDNRDRGGKSNYGMDQENDSDGSPTMTPRINHMGYEGSGNIGTGV